MKNRLVLTFKYNLMMFLFCMATGYAQEVVPAVQVREIDEVHEVPFAVIEKIPQFQSCESTELKTGML